MDFGRAFKYPLSDSGWLVKCLIAFVMCLTCIGFPCTVGYMLRAARNAAHNKPLPDWSDFGGLWIDGFRVGVMQLGYVFPGVLIMLIASFLGGGVMSMGGDSGSASGGGMLIMIAGWGFGGILAFLGGLIASVAYVFLMREDASLGDAFAVGNIQKLVFSNIGTVGLFVVFAIITNIIASLIGNLTFGIGLIIASPYGMLVTAALYGQLATILMPSQFD